MNKAINLMPEAKAVDQNNLTFFNTCKYLLYGLLVALVCSVGQVQAKPTNSDPWEATNRKVHAFNNSLDKAVLKPIARGYRFIMPSLIREGVGNFFRNISEIPGVLNKVMQGRPKKTASGLLRLLVNSTIGVFGIFDLASRMGLKYEYEDFGQTLAVWGMPSGPYTVLPVFGPSTVRTAIGRLVNFFMNPLSIFPIDDTQVLLLRGVQLVDQRASLLSLEFVVTGDEYEFYRNAYLQRRDYLIHDGLIEDPFLSDEF